MSQQDIILAKLERIEKMLAVLVPQEPGGLSPAGGISASRLQELDQIGRDAVFGEKRRKVKA